jgi:hypothetical protein
MAPTENTPGKNEASTAATTPAPTDTLTVLPPAHSAETSETSETSVNMERLEEDLDNEILGERWPSQDFLAMGRGEGDTGQGTAQPTSSQSVDEHEDRKTPPAEPDSQSGSNLIRDEPSPREDAGTIPVPPKKAPPADQGSEAPVPSQPVQAMSAHKAEASATSYASVNVSGLEDDLDEDVLRKRAPELLPTLVDGAGSQTLHPQSDPIPSEIQAAGEPLSQNNSGTIPAPSEWAPPADHEDSVSGVPVQAMSAQVVAASTPLSARARGKQRDLGFVSDTFQPLGGEHGSFEEEAIHQPAPIKFASVQLDDKGKEAAPYGLTHLEAGSGHPAATLVNWLVPATKINPAVIAGMTKTPEMLDAVIAAAKAQADADAERFMPHYERELEDIKGPPTWADVQHWLGSAARESTAWTDLKHSGEFREMLRGLEIPHGDQKFKHLDLVKSVFKGLSDKIDALDNSPDLAFIKEKSQAGIKTLLKSVDAAAFDQAGPERLKSIVSVAGTLMIGVLPFAFAAQTNPTSWFYLGGLAGAYARTITLVVGMMRAGSITSGMIKEHVKERQAVWALPAVFYSAQAYIIAYSLNNPEDHDAEHLAHGVEQFEKPSLPGIGFLIFVGIAEMLIFLAINHPASAKKTGESIVDGIRGRVLGNEPSQSSRFESGEMRVAETEDNQGKLAAIRSDFQLGAGLLQAFGVASDKWEKGEWSDEEKTILTKTRQGDTLTPDEKAILKRARGKGEKLSSSEKALLTEVRQSLGQLSTTLDLVVGGIQGSLQLISKDQKAQKRKVTQALLAVGGVLGVISSAATLRVPALLTDYIPYYVSTEILLWAQDRDDSFLPADVARTFGSYFGGTVLGLAPSLGNVLSLMFSDITGDGFLKGDGLFDIVSGSDTTKGHNPNTAIAKTPSIHLEDGKVNFGFFVIFSVLSVLWVSGKVGQSIADAVIEKMERSLSGQEAGGSQQGQQGVDSVSKTVRDAVAMVRKKAAEVKKAAVSGTADNAARFEEIEMTSTELNPSPKLEATDNPDFVEGSSTGRRGLG